MAEVFNYFFQQYLGQATINIPGLGDVTPAEIEALQNKDIQLENQINALQINVRSGNGIALPSGNNTVPIVFTSAMPNNSYSIAIEFVDASGTANQDCSWAVVGGTKLDAGISIRFIDVPSGINTFNYTVRQIPT